MIARRNALRTFALLAAVLVACTGHESSSSSGESAASVAGPDAPAGAGHGHLQLTGDVSVDTDFAVEQCTIGPAGDGLLDGYHMNAKATHGTLQLLSLAVKSYEGDGTFTPPVDTGKTAIVGKHGVSGPLSITIGRENSTVPLPVITRPESKLTITIADSGSRGTAEFTDMTSPVAMEDVDIKAPLHAKHKSFAGSLSWHCPSVDHLDAATTDAAKSMTKGLTPIH
ncbi:MAG TPA: hypothetical protein VGO46_19235 [Gemmatimonadaceae bacterium]|jgi:hypothetical protein|nr:hypothetical protein [Gemmatimonadaceae bacterium]